MNHKSLLGTAVAAALLFGAQAVSACAISAWSSPTGLTVADTGEPPAGFSRYSGRCSVRVQNTNGGTGRFVTDTTPNNEASYRVRFYYFTGDISGATDIFQARSSTATNVIRVAHDGNQLSFSANTGGAAQNVTVLDNRYHAIELAWAAGAGTGSMTATVTGAGNTVAAGTATFSNLANSADSITEARLGLITGTPTVTAPVFFDEFDSRRTQNPGRLCRGDANGNGTLTGGDAQAVINETVNGVIAIGQPDANENGGVTGGDAQNIINLVVNVGATCS